MKTKFINYVAAVIAIALAAVFCFPLSAEEEPHESPSLIDIHAQFIHHEIDRSLPVFVEAYYNAPYQTISMTCYGLGLAEVYIVDSFGQIFCTRTINYDTDSSVVLEAPTAPGTYWLVIMSYTYYGEGEFIVI